MYISRIFLDGRKHDTARAMYNRGIFHGAIENCFTGDRQHPLWRIDKSEGRLSVMIVSKDEPNLNMFYKQFGVDGVLPQTKDYDLFLKKGFHTNDILKFHLTANPTIKKNNKRIPLNMNKTENVPYCAMDWLVDRLKGKGAEVLSAQISSYESHKITGNNKKITLAAATYDGVLKVTDESEFAKLLSQGVGHGKAYGCGMISVMH